jgi:hypothetical protein
VGGKDNFGLGHRSKAIETKGDDATDARALSISLHPTATLTGSKSST